MNLRILIAVMIVIVISSMISLIYLMTTNSSSRTVFISTSALDKELGGKWSVIARGQLKDPTGVSPIIVSLSRGSVISYYSSYRSSSTNLTIMLFKYNTTNLHNITQTIEKIYETLNWTVKNISGKMNGFYVCSPDSQYLYSNYKDYIMIVVITGAVYPNESVQVASLQEQFLN